MVNTNQVPAPASSRAQTPSKAPNKSSIAVPSLQDPPKRQKRVSFMLDQTSGLGASLELSSSSATGSIITHSPSPTPTLCPSIPPIPPHPSHPHPHNHFPLPTPVPQSPTHHPLPPPIPIPKHTPSNTPPLPFGKWGGDPYPNQLEGSGPGEGPDLPAHPVSNPPAPFAPTTPLSIIPTSSHRESQPTATTTKEPISQSTAPISSIPTSSSTAANSTSQARSPTSAPSSTTTTAGPLPNILNLSSHELSPDQYRALDLGLKFATSPKEDPDILEFFDLFQQRCQWAFKRITGGTIPTLPKVMEDRLALMREKLSSLEHVDFPSNISINVRRSIQQLQNNKNIVIRQADKGSCIVLEDKTDYIKAGNDHLANTDIYIKSDIDRTVEIAHKANWAVTHHHNLGIINSYQKGQLLTDANTVRTQRMYFLKKVHKDPYSLRPIVSASSGPTEKISGFLVKLLAPHLEDVKSLVKNSQQVINVLEGLDLHHHPDCRLVSFDVTSLYPSIPQGAGIELVLQRVCPTTPPTSRDLPFKNMLRDLLRITLGDNHFCFNEEFYTQKSGVAMGTKCAPHLANLFMGAIEEKALTSWSGLQPTIWLRFIDDIFMIWEGSKEELTQFHHHLNCQMSSINFTMEESLSSMVFLDIRIFKGHRFQDKGILDISQHIKETNPQNFLHFSSCHPFSTFRTVVRGEIIRAIRCSSSRSIFMDTLNKLLQKLKERGYPSWLLREESENVNYSKRKEFLQPKERRSLEADVTLFSSIFTPAVSSRAIREALEDEETPFTPMVLRPRPTSLQDRLVRAKTTLKNIRAMEDQR